MVGTRNRRMSTDARGQIPESRGVAQAQISGEFGLGGSQFLAGAAGRWAGRFAGDGLRMSASYTEPCAERLAHHACFPSRLN